MMDHDRPELRARVRAELLYPTKPRLTKAQELAMRQYYERGYSVGYLAHWANVTERDVYRVLQDDDGKEQANG